MLNNSRFTAEQQLARIRANLLSPEQLFARLQAEFLSCDVSTVKDYHAAHQARRDVRRLASHGDERN